MGFIAGVCIVVLGLIDTIEAFVWHLYAADPGWGDRYAQLKTAAYPYDLAFGLATLLLGAVIVIAAVLYRRRFRCSVCGGYVQKGQNYCESCGEKL